MRRPDTSWTAVVRGAVICGTEKATLRNVSIARPCKRNYGILVDAKFSLLEHQEQDRVVDTQNGLVMAQGQIHWLLDKGDLILSDKQKKVEVPIAVSFPDDTKGRRELAIY